jgi:hypothetical protein
LANNATFLYTIKPTVRISNDSTNNYSYFPTFYFSICPTVRKPFFTTHYATICVPFSTAKLQAINSTFWNTLFPTNRPTIQ